MEFYEDIANRLFLNKTEIDGTRFTDPFEYIEAMHLVAPFKGGVFYDNLLPELHRHWRAKTPLKKGERYSEDFKKYLDYCKTKIGEAAPNKPVAIKDIVDAERKERPATIPANDEKEELLKLFHPDSLLKINRDFEQGLRTLPLTQQQDYYETIYLHFFNEKEHVLRANHGTADKEKIDGYRAFYDDRISYAKGKLEQIKKKLEIEKYKDPNDGVLPNRLSLRQIALLYCYKGGNIQRGESANKIAQENGYRSGDKLYQFFSFYSDRRHRINMIEGSGQEITFTKKVALLESVIECLSSDHKVRETVKDELKILIVSGKNNDL